MTGASFHAATVSACAKYLNRSAKLTHPLSSATPPPSIERDAYRGVDLRGESDRKMFMCVAAMAHDDATGFIRPQDSRLSMIL
jgi:hypothetical protein